jgi:hypothetical protein
LIFLNITVILIVSFLDKILNFLGLKIVRPIKHESKMTNDELLNYYEWALNLNFTFLAKDFLEEMEKRNLVKK